MRITKFNKI